MYVRVYRALKAVTIMYNLTYTATFNRKTIFEMSYCNLLIIVIAFYRTNRIRVSYILIQ